MFTTEVSLKSPLCQMCVFGLREEAHTRWGEHPNPTQKGPLTHGVQSAYLFFCFFFVKKTILNLYIAPFVCFKIFLVIP